MVCGKSGSQLLYGFVAKQAGHLWTKSSMSASSLANTVCFLQPVALLVILGVMYADYIVFALTEM